MYWERNFKDRKQDGKEVMFYENGQVWLEANYKDGKSDRWVEYHENGRVKKEGNNIKEWYYEEDID